MKLYFMRHGESEANVAQLYASNDSPLTPHGREQARLAGEAARGMHFSKILASDYPRAQETARIFAEACGLSPEIITAEPRLRELGVGNLAGQPTRGNAGYLEHQADPQGDTAVETMTAVYARLGSLIRSLQELEDDYVLLVGHTGSGMVLRTLLTGDTTPLDQQPYLPNAALFELPDPQGAQI